MKITAQILLFFFIAFLLTPTVVRIIEKDAGTSIFYSFSEEENSIKELKEVKAIFNFDPSFETVHFLYNNSSLIQSENLSKKDNVASAIFIPPPDFT